MLLDKDYPSVRLLKDLPENLQKEVEKINFSKNKRCLYKEIEADLRLDAFNNSL